MVAVATFKKDAMFFVGGLLAGIFIFGETIDGVLNQFWNSSYMGRFTLPELFHTSTGVVVFVIVVAAILLFWGAEKTEELVTGKKINKAQRPYKLAGIAVLVIAAFAVAFIGQPTTLDKWEQIAAEKQPMLDNRDVYIQPAELLDNIYNDHIDVIMLDIRSESDYNLFHVQDAQRASLDDLQNMVKEFMQKPNNTLFVVMSNDEAAATEAWKTLVAESVVNVYILEGGVNNWIATYNVEESGEEGGQVAAARPTPKESYIPGDDTLHYNFPAALGDMYAAATPEPHNFEIEYTPKVKLELKQAAGGG